MNKQEVLKVLQAVEAGKLSPEQALNEELLKEFGDLGFATIDNFRETRVGYPEVIYGEGKTCDQVATIAKYMTGNGQNVLVTRASLEMYEAVKAQCSHAEYNDIGRTIVIINKEIEVSEHTIAIISAGTSDLPVVEEAYETAKIFGNRVNKIVDVGVAGIHRLFNRLDAIREARVVIVVAGMEGALASVIGGLVDKPVIAVPTSVGYGANLGGVTTLLAMLNSCASGVSVVNIDNGFGAAYSASMINQL